MDDAAGGLGEDATFCKKNDDKRPSLVGLPDGTTRQICPVDGSEVKDGVSNAYPQGWFVRIEFDELLDPSIEDLTEILDDTGQPTGTYSGSIAATHPVELKCTGVSGTMVNIPYDGYYSPAGNNVTWPLGPSLVIKPNVPASVPTNSHCQVTINDNVIDKNDGAGVPKDQLGPYAFEVAGITVASISPADKDHLDPVDAGMDVLFNTLIDPMSVDDSKDWAFSPDLHTTPVLGAAAAITAVATTFQVNEDAAPSNGFYDPVNVGVGSEPGCVPDDPAPNTATCDTNILIDGEQMHLIKIDYTTAPFFTYTVSARTAGAAHAANALVTTPDANNTLSIGFGPHGAQVGPAIGFPVVGTKPIGANEWLVIGDYKAETDYEWTLPQGTKLKDMCGVETTFGAPSIKNNTDVHFSINKLSFTGITPTDGTMAALPGSKIQLKFNQTMNPDSLAGRCSTDATVQCFSDGDCSAGTCTGVKFTLTPTIPNLSVIQDLTDGSKLDIYGDYQLNTSYTFAIPAGTQIAECPGGETLSGLALGVPHNGQAYFGWYGGGCDTKDVKSFTIANAQSVTFKTAAAIVMTGSSPADNAKITKPQTIGSGARSSIRLTFNQEMDPSTLVAGPTGYEISPPIAAGMSVGIDAGNIRNIRLRPKTGCSPPPVGSSSCTGYAPGTYTFTLHAGATIKDYLGNVYTQPSDLVIHFTVTDPDPTPACIP